MLALLDDQPESVREGVRLGAGVKSAAVSDPGATACVSSIRSDSPCPGVGRRAPVAFSLGRNPRGGSSSASRSTSHTPFDELGGPGVGQRLRQTVAPGLVFGLQLAQLGPPCRPRLRPGRPAFVDGDAGVAALAEPALPLGVRHAPWSAAPAGVASDRRPWRAVSRRAGRAALTAGSVANPPEKNGGFFGPRLVNGTSRYPTLLPGTRLRVLNRLPAAFRDGSQHLGHHGWQLSVAALLCT